MRSLPTILQALAVGLVAACARGSAEGVESVDLQPIAAQALGWPAGHASVGQARELRLWIGGSGVPFRALRLVESAEHVTGEYAWYWPAGHGEDETLAHTWMQEHPGACPRLIRRPAVWVCPVRFDRSPAWNEVWRALERQRIWTLPDPDTLSGMRRIVLDGMWLSIERLGDRRYEVVTYDSPSLQPWPGAPEADSVMSIVLALEPTPP